MGRITHGRSTSNCLLDWRPTAYRNGGGKILDHELELWKGWVQITFIKIKKKNSKWNKCNSQYITLSPSLKQYAPLDIQKIYQYVLPHSTIERLVFHIHINNDIGDLTTLEIVNLISSWSAYPLLVNKYSWE